MRRVLVGVGLGLLLLILAPYNSYADTCGCTGKTGEGAHMMEWMKHRGMGMTGPGQRMWGSLRGLGLDEKQQEAIKEIRSRVMKDAVRKRAEIQVARIELRDILGKDPVDMNAAEAKLKQLSAMVTDLRLSGIKAREEVKTQLTPEQREKFKRSLERPGRWAHGRTGM